MIIMAFDLLRQTKNKKANKTAPRHASLRDRRQARRTKLAACQFFISVHNSPPEPE